MVKRGAARGRVPVSQPRWLLAAAVALALVLTACTGSPATTSPTARTSPVSPPKGSATLASGFVDAGGGFGVEPSAASVLSARATDVTADAPSAEGLPTWQRLAPVFDVAVKRQPTAATRVAIPLDATTKPGAAIVVMTRHSATDAWEPLVATVAPDGRSAIATVTHFSFFTALGAPLQELLTQVRQLTEGFLSGAVSEAHAPNCSGGGVGLRGGWTVGESGRKALAWCMDVDGASHVLRVVNMRRYPLLVRHPGAVTTGDSQSGLVKLVSDRAPGYKGAVLLPPREGVAFVFKGSGGVRSEFDGLAQSMVAFLAAWDAGTLVMPKGPSARFAQPWLVAKFAVESGKCADAMASGDPVKTITTCLNGSVLEAAYGAWGAVLAVMLTTTALLEFFRAELNAAGDQLNGRDVTTLTVSAPTLPSPQAQAEALGNEMLRLSTLFDSGRMRAMTGSGTNPLADDLDQSMEAVTDYNPCHVPAAGQLSCETVVVIGPKGPGNVGIIYRLEFKKDASGRVSLNAVIPQGDAG